MVGDLLGPRMVARAEYVARDFAGITLDVELHVPPPRVWFLNQSCTAESPTARLAPILPSRWMGQAQLSETLVRRATRSLAPLFSLRGRH